MKVFTAGLALLYIKHTIVSERDQIPISQFVVQFPVPTTELSPVSSSGFPSCPTERILSIIFVRNQSEKRVLLSLDTISK